MGSAPNRPDLKQCSTGARLIGGDAIRVIVPDLCPSISAMGFPSIDPSFRVLQALTRQMFAAMPSDIHFRREDVIQSTSSHVQGKAVNEC